MALAIFKQYATETNDRRLVAWLQLQIIAEDVEAMKREAEMSSDPAVVEHINVKEKSALLEQRLRDWEAKLDRTLLTGMYSSVTLGHTSSPYKLPSRSILTCARASSTNLSFASITMSRASVCHHWQQNLTLLCPAPALHSAPRIPAYCCHLSVTVSPSWMFC